MAKTAIVLGATGLVGKQVLGKLLESEQYDRVVALVRKPMLWKHSKLETIQFDFDHPDASQIKGDDLYCCLGTTLAKAGSKEAQYKIDCTYPLQIGQLAYQNAVKQYILVSSIGADAQSSNFYLRTKGELEQGLAKIGFDAVIAVRPSFLLGQRDEFRFGEQMGIGMIKVFGPLLFGSLKKYRGIHAVKVATGMIQLAQAQKKGFVVVESDQLAELG